MPLFEDRGINNSAPPDIDFTPSHHVLPQLVTSVHAMHETACAFVTLTIALLSP